MSPFIYSDADCPPPLFFAGWFMRVDDFGMPPHLTAM
jgi:hypothetical protein